MGRIKEGYDKQEPIGPYRWVRLDREEGGEFCRTDRNAPERPTGCNGKPTVEGGYVAVFPQPSLPALKRPDVS